MIAKKMENINLISRIGGKTMENLLENEAFCVGVSVGIGMYQQKVIAAHKRGQPFVGLYRMQMEKFVYGILILMKHFLAREEILYMK